ncbi:hypothetical protein PENTCL1PPCAC_20474, partial [Pristionchus entomophagus]
VIPKPTADCGKSSEMIVIHWGIFEDRKKGMKSRNTMTAVNAVAMLALVKKVETRRDWAMLERAKRKKKTRSREKSAPDMMRAHFRIAQITMTETMLSTSEISAHDRKWTESPR